MSSHYARLDVPLAVTHLVKQSTIYPMVEGSNLAAPVIGNTFTKIQKVCTKLGQSGQSGQSGESGESGQSGATREIREILAITQMSSNL